MRFVDTNILIYAVSRDPSEERKRNVARQLIDAGDIALSAQVLQEFYTQASRPTRPFALSRHQAALFVESLSQFPIGSITIDIVRAAIAISMRYQLEYWDGAILAAARSLGCDSVLSEDLSPTQDYDGLRVINPFA